MADAMTEPVTPPSVLPDISPSRGESGWGVVLTQSVLGPSSAAGDQVRQRVCNKSLSLLEGEMSGSTEGGGLTPNPHA
jgi:hypothetical protein